MNKIIFPVLVGALIIGGLIYYYNYRGEEPEIVQHENNDPQVENDPVELEAAIGQKITFKGVFIIPLEVLEDSRCPTDVVCIQAGTVRLRAKLASAMGETEQIFKLDETITTEAEEITLSRVLPATFSTKQIKPGEYRFYFTIKKR